jgi:DNA polymerase-3 subunit delta
MAELKPVYLIHGDDHGAVAERRARLRAVAKQEGGETSSELLEGSAATPAGAAGALLTPRLGVGRRVIVVDGVERWKDAEIAQHLVPAMHPMPSDTTLALFAYEDARVRASPALHRAVKDAGGQVAREATLKRRELPRWVAKEGERLGLALDSSAAKTLVAQAGERRQQLLRELEKLALDPGAQGSGGSARAVSAEELRAAHFSQAQVFALADALAEGAFAHAVLSYVRLRGQGERVSGLFYLMASRLRQALSVAVRLQDGEPAQAIRASLRMPATAAERLIADAQSADTGRLQAALCVLADLELHTRGGPVARAGASSVSALEEDTLALLAIEAISEGAR